MTKSGALPRWRDHFGTLRIKMPDLSASTWRKIHLGLTIVWSLLVFPTVLWWHESILWVGLISCWANAVGHFSAWQATRIDPASSPFWRRLHLVMTIAWFLLIAPTILWWSTAVVWVGLMSCYANAVGHFSAWQVTKVEEATP